MPRSAARHTAGYAPNPRRRDIATGVIGAIGSGLAVAGFSVLVVRAAAALPSGAAEPGYIVGVSLYGACLIYRFVMSSLAGFMGGRGALRSLDEAGPFFLAAGTLMPILFAFMSGAWRWVMFGLAWGYAALGFLFYLAFLGVVRQYVIPLGYIFFFLIFPVIGPVRDSLGAEAFTWIFSGGAFYLFGFVFRGKHGFPYANAVWNAFALAGSVLQYFGISAAL